MKRKLRREYEFSMVMGTERLAHELLGRLGPKMTRSTVEIIDAVVSVLAGRSGKVMLSVRCIYTVKGNTPYDMRRMVAKAARGVDRGSNGWQNINYEEFTVRPIGSGTVMS